MHTTHSDTSCETQVQRKCSAVQKIRRERKTEKDENKTAEITKTEKLCCVQHFSSLLLLATWKVIDEQGCNPSCLNEYKYTPLHCAAMSRSMNVVKFLTVEKRCDPMCRDLANTNNSTSQGSTKWPT